MSKGSVSREQTIERLRKAATAFSFSDDHTVADRVEELAELNPNHVFVYYLDKKTTYRAHNEIANRLANVLYKRGVRQGDRVALLMENRPEYFATWSGVAKLGAVTPLINSNIRGAALQHALLISEAHTLVVGAECLENLATIDLNVLSDWDIYVWDDPYQQVAPVALNLDCERLDDLLQDASKENPPRSLRAGRKIHDEFIYIYSSGTTGLPKACRVTHEKFLGAGEAHRALCDYTETDVYYAFMPLYHGASGLVVPSCAFATGGAVALRRRFSASEFWSDCRRYGVTGFQYIGEICRFLLNQPPRDDDKNHSVRAMHGGGLRKDVWEQFSVRFGIENVLEGYGATEANGAIMNVDNKIGSCGRIPYKEYSNARLVKYDLENDRHYTDENGFLIECGVDEVGEFIAEIRGEHGPQAFYGYTSVEATEKKILRNVFKHGDAWYRGGDLLKRDEDDYYYFVDRIGDTYRWKGENVSTVEVAEQLIGSADLESVNIYGVRVPGQEGRAGMAAIVMRPHQKFNGEKFYKQVSESLPRYAQPVFVRVMEEADVTEASLKLRKFFLQKEGYDYNSIADPLYIRDENNGTYAKLDADSLHRLDVLPFELHD